MAGAIGRLLADPVIMQAMSGKAASMFDAEKVRSLPVKTAILGAIK
ncbi:hypothetical protein QS257_16715 [Terrilactibacillus sp. S3-3]|nr:hypothetical protein QS257_16715 [Terrilactibacillus sp. S3-3]